MKALLMIAVAAFLGFPCATHSEIITSEGTAETFVMVKRKGFECEPTITAKCELGQPCFATIVITGPPAKSLYDVMRRYPIKFDETEGISYLGTNNDKMRCKADGLLYSCSIGYDVIANSLSKIPILDCE